MVVCVSSQLKPSELYILSCGEGLGLSTAKNVVLLWHYPIHSNTYDPFFVRNSSLSDGGG